MDGALFPEGPLLVPTKLESYGYAPVLAASIEAGVGCHVTWCDPQGMMRCHMSYAALRDDGLTLAVGGARGSLWSRWEKILKVIQGENCWQMRHDTGALDPGSWGRALRGRQFQVWARKAMGQGAYSMLDQDVSALSVMLCPALGVSEGQQFAANWAWAPDQNSFSC